MRNIIIISILGIFLAGCVSPAEKQAQIRLFDQQLESERQRLDIPKDMWSGYVSNFKQRKCGGWESQWGKNWRQWAVKDAPEYFKPYIDRQNTIKAIKAQYPDSLTWQSKNWQSALWFHDLQKIQSDREHTSNPSERLEQINEAYALISENVNIWTKKAITWQSKNQMFLQSFNDEALEVLKKICSELDASTDVSMELWKRKAKEILGQDAYKELWDITMEQGEIVTFVNSVNSISQKLADEEAALRQQIQIENMARARAIQAFGNSLQNSYYQQQQQQKWNQLNNTLMNMQLNSPKIRTNNFGQIIDNIGQPLQYGR